MPVSVRAGQRRLGPQIDPGRWSDHSRWKQRGMDFGGNDFAAAITRGNNLARGEFAIALRHRDCKSIVRANFLLARLPLATSLDYRFGLESETDLIQALRQIAGVTDNTFGAVRGPSEYLRLVSLIRRGFNGLVIKNRKHSLASLAHLLREQ